MHVWLSLASVSTDSLLGSYRRMDRYSHVGTPILLDMGYKARNPTNSVLPFHVVNLECTHPVSSQFLFLINKVYVVV